MITELHDVYVSRELALLLKQAGFDWECHKIYYCYHEDGDNWELEDNNKNTKRVLELDYCLLAPTLEVAQRWLREVKNCYTGIDVFVRNLDKNNTYYNRWFVYFNGTRYSGSNYDDTQYYEDAQEAGIKKALEIILEIGE